LPLFTSQKVVGRADWNAVCHSDAQNGEPASLMDYFNREKWCCRQQFAD
jgi:hypothetical protein